MDGPMLYNYVALLIFIAFAVFIPSSFVLAAKMLGRKKSPNPVKNAPYESGEETVGSARDVDNEYMPYFLLFLPFEIIVAILLLWSSAAQITGYMNSIEILGLGVISTALAFAGYKLIGVGNGR